MGRRGGDLRHYVIHGDLTPEATLRTMAERGIGVNMNATIKYLLGRTLDPVLGTARTDYQWPYRTALDLGINVTGASDAPVTFPTWLQGIQSAVLREGRFGGVAGEAERITVREALVTYTRTPAWQDHADRRKGTLEVGKAADICVVGGDVLNVDPHELISLPIDATVLGRGAGVPARGIRHPRLIRQSRLAMARPRHRLSGGRELAPAAWRTHRDAVQLMRRASHADWPASSRC
jgi:predicted amidohydrolase YtcJ